MYESISKKLQLIFVNGAGSSNTISPRLFREELTSPEVQSWMDRFCELGLFYSTDKQMPLYTEKKAARIVETKTTEIFNVSKDGDSPELG
ncbi:DUF2922 domain-containing protein [Vagococcus sp. BWB3-3]|uniref:DUF2922 domain-containing protein n=1 Tax=Vagococcus allomyrinae TaxID=2794353 RepID=A0A940PA57_9ENTE|nr:DUF2922 domain-containing protein [Vagococcus allomyrinae]MBP1042436.1 DUF2922 domain-containing protein [Vagococcus allomyrinae]